MTQTTCIPRTLANRLLTLAQLAPKQEVCGFIATDNKLKYITYPIDNIATQTQYCFEMNPQQQINALKNMREKKQTLFAIYHSHPTSDATPSEKDLQKSAYEDALNIIISLSIGGVLDMRGYFYKQNTFEKVDLIIE